MKSVFSARAKPTELDIIAPHGKIIHGFKSSNLQCCRFVEYTSNYVEDISRENVEDRSQLSLFCVKRVQRTPGCVRHIAQDMGIDHGRLDILVAKQILNLPDIDSSHKQMRCKAVS